jgi:hypothetical protein
VAGDRCLFVVTVGGWWLVLIWCERKTLLFDWLTSQANKVICSGV